MNEREKDPMSGAEGRQVQQELEDQLRAFGDTVSDAFAHGFEGRGMDIGDRAYGVGKAAVHAANYGIGEAVKGFRKGRDEYYRGRRNARNGASGSPKQGLNEDYSNAQVAGVSNWFQQVFGKAETTPVDDLRTSARKCRGNGIALLAVGITFAVSFGIAAISCLAVAEAATPLAAAVGDGMVYALGSELLSSAGMTALRVCGNVFTLVTLGFCWMIAAGVHRMKAGKNMNLYADMAEGMDYKRGLSVEMLADLTHQKKAKALKILRKYIRKGWLRAWLDEKTQKLYLTAEDYRAAQEAAAAPRTEPQPEPAATPETDETEKAPLNLETARRFADVLAKEQQVMQDAQARDELDHMQKTTTAICDWLEAHPESLPKARRFAEYYIPTTLKLLHTYNDVQGQQGENAENIRSDIAGILHTLNKAYDNLYDNLLSDVAMDVSSEIAALQGMLANDGLTGREFE